MKGFKTEIKILKRQIIVSLSNLGFQIFNFDAQVHRKEGGLVIYQTVPRIKHN